MFMPKSCPRCHGDLYQDSESNGYCMRCIQCGNEIHLSRALDVLEKPSRSLLEELTVTADASALETEGRSGRPAMYRKLPRRGGRVLSPSLAV